MTAELGWRRPVSTVLVVVVRGYQQIVSPWFAPTCRYHPSCSAYAIGSVRRHGPFKGVALSGWRLLRCNPWSRGGVDPVPERGRWRQSAQEHAHGAAPDAAEVRPASREAVPSTSDVPIQNPQLRI